MSKLAYTTREAAEECGVESAIINEAVRAGDLIARWIGETIVIPHYDLELWLLGQTEYLVGLPERVEREQARRTAIEAERLAKTQQRRLNKEAREAERARAQADIDELERLRKLAGVAA